MAVIAVLAVLLGLLAWFFWPSADRRPPATRADVDAAELEAAERDVQEAPDEHSVRDWGPGVSKPPI